ncbi:MAG TPA: peroxiredoxin [Burkholderiaceae bacterium]|jgi:peroxiredoxin
MKTLLAAAVLAACCTVPAYAALENGAVAPNFTAQASLGGKVFTFSLSDSLKNGPVVLYFYPAAFTPGCTVEAHDFADAVDQYKAMGATVIGVSHDNIDKLNKFSVTECRSKFAVAADTDQHIMKSYDSILAIKPEYSNRTSYVIAPNGKVIYSYTDLSPEKHVENTLAAVKQWRAANPMK